MATHPDSHRPVDKSVILPAAVRAAGAAADALLAGTVPTGPPPPPAQPQHGAAPPPVGHVAASPPAQAPAPAAAPPQQGDGMPPPAEPGSIEYQWEQRYRTLRGRMDAERTGTQREMAGLRAQVDDLMRQRGSAPAPTGSAPAQPNTPIDVSKFITDEDRAQWGDGMAEFIVNKAAAIAAATAGTLQAAVGRELDQTRGDLWARDNASMKTALDQLLPGGNGQADWRVINDDPAYENWLQGADGFSNMTRHQVLLDAWQKNDTQTVYKIFHAYMSGSQPTPAVQVPGAPGVGLPPSGQPQPSHRLPMNGLVAPGPARPASAGTPSAPEPNQYRNSEIAKFFTDLGRGLYNDTAERRTWAAGIEQDIFAAQREGRVIAG